MLGLIVRNALGPIKLGQPGFDFGQKYELFNGIIDGGIWRHRLEGLDNAVAGKWLLHGLIVNTFWHRRNSAGGPSFKLQKPPQLRVPRPFAYFAKGGYDDGLHFG